jgi:hypothetical protein
MQLLSGILLYLTVDLHSRQSPTMHQKLIILFALAVGSTVAALDSAQIARRVPVPNNLVQRDNYTISGGWALLGPTTCPTGTTACCTFQQTSSNSCCPDALVCSLGTWLPDAMCCPHSKCHNLLDKTAQTPFSIVRDAI